MRKKSGMWVEKDLRTLGGLKGVYHTIHHFTTYKKNKYYYQQYMHYKHKNKKEYKYIYLKSSECLSVCIPKWLNQFEKEASFSHKYLHLHMLQILMDTQFVFNITVAYFNKKKLLYNAVQSIFA